MKKSTLSALICAMFAVSGAVAADRLYPSLDTSATLELAVSVQAPAPVLSQGVAAVALAAPPRPPPAQPSTIAKGVTDVALAAPPRPPPAQPSTTSQGDDVVARIAPPAPPPAKLAANAVGALDVASAAPAPFTGLRAAI